MRGPIAVKVLPEDIETLKNALLYMDYNQLCDNFVMGDLKKLLIALLHQADRKAGLD